MAEGPWVRVFGEEARMAGEKVLSGTLKYWLTTRYVPRNTQLQLAVQTTFISLDKHFKHVEWKTAAFETFEHRYARSLSTTHR